ncbi:CBO0543 family protein [Gorillibacterium sp. sgz5001074]|uniref:CBO0543 family protein n=1 Tax=Gorillibacterium sp. sgz5001074 TaxID=3446695 RepID=UPI003F6712DD
MTVERILLTVVWILIMIMLFFIPKGKRREAIIVFLAVQAMTWSSSILLNEWGWIRNPTREFSRAVSQNFTFNFALYPMVAVIHSLYYPRNSGIGRRFSHTLLYTFAISLFICITEAYTSLIQFLKPKWIMILITFLLSNFVLYLAQKYHEWYFDHFPHAKVKS